VTDEDFKKLINRIERDIQTLGKQEVKSSQIGEIIMKHLRKMNHVAYIRFASVYRSFDDVKTFEQELRSLLSPTKAAKARRRTKKK